MDCEFEVGGCIFDPEYQDLFPILGWTNDLRGHCHIKVGRLTTKSWAGDYNNHDSYHLYFPSIKHRMKIGRNFYIPPCPNQDDLEKHILAINLKYVSTTTITYNK